MKITINPYDENSIKKAYNDVIKYKTWLERKEKELLERLASIGATQVSLGYARAIYKGDKDITVSIDVSGNRAVIMASGQSVAFIEFGAGIRYGNGYPGERPPGIVDIGEYGKGKGNNPKGWWYTGSNGSEHTYGNPPAGVMWRTTCELAEEISSIAKEVFDS